MEMEEFLDDFTFGSDYVYKLNDLLNAFQIPYVLFDSKQKIQLMYLTDSLSDYFSSEKRSTDEVFNYVSTNEEPYSKTISLNSASQLHMKGIPVKVSNKLIAVIIIFNITNSMYDEYHNMEIDLKTIFESSYDVLFVSDGNGKVLRVSSACERLWGIKQSNILKRNVFDLETEGVFSPSVTRLVIEQKKKISILQKTCTGKTLLVLGTPVLDESGRVARVINASRDVTEIHQLLDELTETRHLLEHYQDEILNLKSQKQSFKLNKLVYQSEEMVQIVEQVRTISPYETPVLITGESGVGKEIIASLIHDWSYRSNQPFIKVNCGAIPETLLESELFGYEKGTFTGANKEGKDGLFFAANNGTILLDEITEMPVSLQVKLLRVLQEQEILPVGSTKLKKINVRVISTTNREMKSLIEQKEFREDLYYRLNGMPVEVPPLRNRKADIRALINYFTEEFNHYYGKNKLFAEDAIAEMMKSDWKGNVRELKNIVDRMLILSSDNLVEKSFAIQFIGSDQKSSQGFHFEILQDLDLYKVLSNVEKQIIEYTASKYNTTTEMARSLHINQSTVSKKLKKYNIRIK